MQASRSAGGGVTIQRTGRRGRLFGGPFLRWVTFEVGDGAFREISARGVLPKRLSHMHVSFCFHSSVVTCADFVEPFMEGWWGVLGLLAIKDIQFYVAAVLV